jgi:hypothetical protein
MLATQKIGRQKEREGGAVVAISADGSGRVGDREVL